jgi:hypothetical protein
LYRNFYNFGVALGNTEESKKFLMDRALLMKGRPGFLDDCVLKDSGEHAGSKDYAFMHDWRSPQNLKGFMEKGATTPREYFTPPKLERSASHEHQHAHLHEHKNEAEKGAIHLGFHSHDEVIFQL